MKLKELKSIIKDVVNEVIAERYMESAFERYVAKRMTESKDFASAFTKTSAELREQALPKKAPELDKESLRQKLMEQVKDEQTRFLYEDSLKSNEPSQGVSEQLMEKMGTYNKDYSKYF